MGAAKALMQHSYICGSQRTVCGGMSSGPPLIGLDGGGFYISWILGVGAGMQRIGTPLHQCVFSGASAGASVAALLACGVDMRVARDWLLHHPKSVACFTSPVGAAFRVHDVMTSFMRAMLPADAAQRCRGRLHIIVCSRRRGCYFVSDFRNTEDIIEAVASSTHMPYFSDGKYSYMYRGEEHIDGAWGSSKWAVLLCADSDTKVRIAHDDDKAMPDNRPFYEVVSMAAQVARFERGVAYASELDALGGLPREIGIYANAASNRDESASGDHQPHRLEGHHRPALGENRRGRSTGGRGLRIDG